MHALIAASLVLLVVSLGKAQTGMEVNVPRCSESPDLQAGLEARAWNPAIVLSNFYQIAETNKPASAVTARLMRDDNWFYVGMDIRHPLPAYILPKLGQRDGRVQGEDCVKLVLSPARSSYPYIFRLSAGNVKADQYGSITWDAPWRSAVKRTETGWQGIMAIPLKTFAGEMDWSDVRVNLIALVYRKVLDANQVVVDEERLLFGLHSTSAQWWNDVKLYGRMRGLDGGNKPSVLPAWKQPVVEGYTVTNGKYQYAVSMELRNEGSGTGTAWVGVSDLPLKGKGTSAGIPVPMGVGETNTVRLDVPVTSFSQRGLTITLGEKKGDDCWDRLVLDKAAVLDICGNAYLDRNYYTTETKARAGIHLNFPPEALAGMTARVENKSGETLGSAPAAAVARVEFDIGTLAVGKTPLKIKLVDAKNALIHAQDLECVKRPPHPAGEWKIDKENRRVLRDGQPFFVRGSVVHVGDRCSSGARAYPGLAEAIPDVKAAGFNAAWMISMNPFIGITNILYPFEIAQKSDMLVLAGLDSYAGSGNELYVWRSRLLTDEPYRGLTASQKSQVYADVARIILPRQLESSLMIKDHPNMLGYQIGEEPTVKSRLDQITPGHELYKHLTETDGYHPSVVIYNGAPPADDPSYVTWCDILANDPYWGPPVQATVAEGEYYSRYRDINLVSDQTRKSWKLAEVIRGPIWIVPVAENVAGTHKRPMLPAEQFCQTYLALIHGAKGLFYFTHPWKYQNTFDVFKSLNKQLEVLGPIVLAPEIEQTVTYSQGGFDGSARDFPAVQVALKQRPEGGYVLLAANSKPWPVDVQYRISNLGEGDMVSQLFADWKTPVKDGMFGEQLEGFGVRAYGIPRQKSEVRSQKSEIQSEIENLSAVASEAKVDRKPVRHSPDSPRDRDDGGSKIEIQVSMQAHPEMITPEENIPKSGRPGKKNLLPNPGFEKVTVPGIPDYYGTGPGNLMGPRVGAPGAWFALCNERPYEGKHALKLSNFHDVPSAGQGFAFSVEPRLDKPAKFVFSAYMRAERDDLSWPNRSDPQAGKTYMICRGPGGNKGHAIVKLTTEWKRYWFKVDLPAGDNREMQCAISFYGKGSIWVDAMQFEKGEAPTEYEP